MYFSCHRTASRPSRGESSARSWGRSGKRGRTAPAAPPSRHGPGRVSSRPGGYPPPGTSPGAAGRLGAHGPPSPPHAPAPPSCTHASLSHTTHAYSGPHVGAAFVSETCLSVGSVCQPCMSTTQMRHCCHAVTKPNAALSSSSRVHSD